MSSNKVTLHRVLTASPEKTFRAFSNEDAMAFWPRGHSGGNVLSGLARILGKTEKTNRTGDSRRVKATVSVPYC